MRRRKALNERMETAELPGGVLGSPEPMSDEEKVPTADRVRLRGIRADAVASESEESWFSAVEEVTQQSMRQLSEHSFRGDLEGGVRALESIVFAQGLTEVAKDWSAEQKRLPPELKLFTDPVVLVSFQVHDRRYQSVEHCCSKYPWHERKGGADLESMGRQRTAISMLSRLYSSQTIQLEQQPTFPELFAYLFDYLDEEFVERKMSTFSSAEAQAGRRVWSQEVHSARRSAIRDWQARMEGFYAQHYHHVEVENLFFTYPLVDVRVPDNMHLVLLMISPLDEKYLDEKITADQRCAEICLAVYHLENDAFPPDLDALIPHLRQSFGRVLFSSRYEAISRALTSSFDAQSAILRHWVSETSKGYKGIVEESGTSGTFDAWTFCEAVVRNILCAKIPGVETEVYPFDRAFIFQETGTTSRFDRDVPVETLVLEASVLSHNPADRFQYLTRHERRIRGTADFECDFAQKTIEDHNKFRFFIHGAGEHLVLSPRNLLTDQQLLGVQRGFRYQLPAQDFIALMDMPDQEDCGELSLLLHNLFGRLMDHTYSNKAIVAPDDASTTVAEYTGFSVGFEAQRLQVSGRYDENGLLYHYEHGIGLAERVPLLHQLQSAYFAFLERKFREADRRFRREALAQENISTEQIQSILDRYDDRRSQEREELQDRGERYSKVVFISFSWVLNDANMAFSFGDGNSEDPPLSGEFRYTIVLVCDRDPEKSLSQLNGERENLKLFFQLIMKRIWMDRLAERDFLESRRRIVEHGLGHFLHRAKGMTRDDRSRQELQNCYDNLRQLLLTPHRDVAFEQVITSPEEMFARLLDTPGASPAGAQEIEARLRELVATWMPERIGQNSLPTITVSLGFMPRLRVRWPLGVVLEAFHVLLKNACEAAVSDCVPESQKAVCVQIQTVPSPAGDSRSPWYVDVVVVNPGGPIPPARLRALTAKEPRPTDCDWRKKGSTGVAVFLARYELQNIVGRGSDLLFADLGEGFVQSRLRLPAELAQDLRLPGTNVEGDGLPGGLDGDYVLYVEDANPIYEEAVPAIAAALPSGIRLEHRLGHDAALRLIEKKLPRAVFTDVIIPRDEEVTDLPRFKYGLKLLQRLMQLAKARTTYPPIWVMTAEEESAIRNNLKDADQGYRFVRASGSSPKQLAQAGSICIFSGKKHPGEVSNLLLFFKEVFRSEQADEPLEASGPVELPTSVVSLALDEVESGEIAEIYRDVQGYSPPGLLVVRSGCAGLAELHRDLSRWAMHPGLPDPALSRLDTKYRLTNHVLHQELVLALELGESLFESLPIQFLYWALSANVWIESSASDYKEMARTWRLIRNEDRGPLSLLRHTLRNLWWGDDLSPLLTSMLVKLVNCEKQVLLSPKDAHDLNSLLAAGFGEGSRLHEYLREPAEVARDRASFRTALGELDKSLVAAVVRTPQFRADVDRQRSMLQSLNEYLGGD